MQSSMEVGVRSNYMPDAEESKRFWADIWFVAKEHNREAEWLKDLKNDLENEGRLQESVIISVEKVTKEWVIKQCTKNLNKAERK